MRVLVVEDNEDLALSIEDVLAEAGHEVVLCTPPHCADAQALSARLSGNRFDVVLLDLTLDWIRPDELLRLVAVESLGAPIVLCTGAPKRRITPLLSHVVAVVRKPFDPADLLRTLEDAVRARPRERPMPADEATPTDRETPA